MSHRRSKRIRRALKDQGVDVKTWDGRDAYKKLKKMSKTR